MPKCSVFVATSLDGFIARVDGSIDWLDEANSAIPADADLGFEKFIASVDVLVMGRKTFEKVLTFESWPYGEIPVIILSRTLKNLSEKVPETVSISNEPPLQLARRLEKEGYNHIYVDGGATIHSFLDADLIDEVTITVIPVLIGDGIPLFGKTKGNHQFKLVSNRAYDFGYVQNKYCKKANPTKNSP